VDEIETTSAKIPGSDASNIGARLLFSRGPRTNSVRAPQTPVGADIAHARRKLRATRP